MRGTSSVSIRLSGGSYILFARDERFADGIADIIERRRALTTSEDLKTAATSGSNTIATVPSDI